MEASSNLCNLQGIDSPKWLVARITWLQRFSREAMGQKQMFGALASSSTFFCAEFLLSGEVGACPSPCSLARVMTHDCLCFYGHLSITGAASDCQCWCSFTNQVQTPMSESRSRLSGVESTSRGSHGPRSPRMQRTLSGRCLTRILLPGWRQRKSLVMATFSSVSSSQPHQKNTMHP